MIKNIYNFLEDFSTFIILKDDILLDYYSHWAKELRTDLCIISFERRKNNAFIRCFGFRSKKN